MFLVFDIGGTKIRVAISEDGNSLSAPIIFSTPQNFQEAIARFKLAAQELSCGRKIIAAAGGVPGPLDRDKKMLLRAPNLQGWAQQPLAEALSQAIAAPVFLENDAALVGLGEATVGAGRGFPIVAYFTVSTGIGGARIVHGAIDERAVSFEPGHQIIAPDGPPCVGCGGIGHLEAIASGSAIARCHGKPPEEIKDPAVWEEAAHWLAIGLNNSIVHWSPDAVVIGGSVMRSLSFERVRAHLTDLLHIFPEPPVLKPAILGDLGGLHGALAHLRNQLPSHWG